MTTEPGPKPKRSTTLIVSLCINFFLVGVIAAGALGALHHFQRSGGDRDGFDPRALMHMLPDARRTELEPLLHGSRDEVRALLDAARDAREDAYRAFKQETFDAAAFDAAMTKVRTADDAVARATQTIIAEIAAKLSPDERARLARHLIERRWDDHRGGRHGPFGGDRDELDDDGPEGPPPPSSPSAPPSGDQ